MEEKIKEVIAELEKRQEDYSNKAQFCRDHNFKLDSDRFYDLEQEVRKTQRLIEKTFDL